MRQVPDRKSAKEENVDEGRSQKTNEECKANLPGDPFHETPGARFTAD
jgi:hypothetical protein